MMFNNGAIVPMKDMYDMHDALPAMPSMMVTADKEGCMGGMEMGDRMIELII